MNLLPLTYPYSIYKRAVCNNPNYLVPKVSFANVRARYYGDSNNNALLRF